MDDQFQKMIRRLVLWGARYVNVDELSESAQAELIDLLEHVLEEKNMLDATKEVSSTLGLDLKVVLAVVFKYVIGVIEAALDEDTAQ